MARLSVLQEKVDDFNHIGITMAELEKKLYELRIERDRRRALVVEELNRLGPGTLGIGYTSDKEMFVYQGPVVSW